MTTATACQPGRHRAQKDYLAGNGFPFACQFLGLPNLLWCRFLGGGIAVFPRPGVAAIDSKIEPLQALHHIPRYTQSIQITKPKG